MAMRGYPTGVDSIKILGAADFLLHRRRDCVNGGCPDAKKARAPFGVQAFFLFVLIWLSLKNARESMGSYLGHGFSDHPRRFRGSRWVTANCKQQPMNIWTLYDKGGQGREASTNPSGYDGSPIFDLYSSIRSSEQSMPAASKTIFSVSIFTEVELPGLK